MSEIVIIDRFEKDIAVCERNDRTTFSLPRSSLPAEAREGDVIILENQTARIDHGATTARKNAIEDQLRQLWKHKRKI